MNMMMKMMIMIRKNATTISLVDARVEKMKAVGVAIADVLAEAVMAVRPSSVVDHAAVVVSHGGVLAA